MSYVFFFLGVTLTAFFGYKFHISVKQRLEKKLAALLASQSRPTAINIALRPGERITVEGCIMVGDRRFIFVREKETNELKVLDIDPLDGVDLENQEMPAGTYLYRCTQDLGTGYITRRLELKCRTANHDASRAERLFGSSLEGVGSGSGLLDLTRETSGDELAQDLGLGGDHQLVIGNTRG